jgi:hypothetical protein
MGDFVFLCMMHTSPSRFNMAQGHFKVTSILYTQLAPMLLPNVFVLNGFLHADVFRNRFFATLALHAISIFSLCYLFPNMLLISCKQCNFLMKSISGVFLKFQSNLFNIVSSFLYCKKAKKAFI